MKDWCIKIPERYSQLGKADRKGRNPYAGFVRGYGISRCNVEELCDADPVFNSAVLASYERTYLRKEDVMNLYMLLRFYLSKIPFGHVVKFGSYLGGSAIFLAKVAKEFLPKVNVIGFDTFSGMPATDPSIDAHFEGEHIAADLQGLRDFVSSSDLGNLRFVEGNFEKTAKANLIDVGPVALVHIDCDIYNSIAYCYEAVKPYLVDGAYIIFDDPLYANCLGAFEAVEENLIKKDGLNAEQVYPHLVFRHPSSLGKRSTKLDNGG